ncbi:Lactate utilization protein B/C (plasmid) [Deinococcus proteolyticus MRP]|uniref:Lactate utilization protein B/C n=1 Tax=Deinococcus proteolyticus (strain ATCC 35074 / DSM 20540 / JCM 6276 / NBRC 101906 / NCIMB 13154 / VKM Ac-1939 / CCM 2703 / MRP) TaxID=693977 RepID=F0RPR8_DEIPM|nr:MULTISPECIES: lactate utilization protein B [Deinococcus]ADY27374.1 Lactate utilization protein B/C [Deinococcus proteolyticus MRP]MCY1704247.1 lactate utilization protein B [Deinococcus sp. SL84]
MSGLHPKAPFPKAAEASVNQPQLRANLRKVTHTIRAKRAAVVAELPYWEQLRQLGAATKDDSLVNLSDRLLELERNVQARGGQVHWARDAAEAREIVARIALAHGERELIKVKSITSDEIELNQALEEHGIHAIETDLAELIVQLSHDTPSHILVPAIHRNRAEIQALFNAELPGEGGLSDNPQDLAAAARRYLRHKFLTTRMAVSGANFAVAETGTVCVVESEGNGRMCLTLPEVLVSIMGIEKVLDTWEDIAVFMETLPRSSTAERMNPYNSFWSGVTEGDGPQEFHLILLDNGRTHVLADEFGRQTLRCIRCSACLNVCPVYERAGGHAYGSVYPGPIGSILTPQLLGMHDKNANSLPFASSLCGACYEVCPVEINIPQVLIYLRNEGNAHKGPNAESLAMGAARVAMSEGWRWEGALRLARLGQGPLVRQGEISWLPGMLAGWTEVRDLPALPREGFREWWKQREVSRTVGASTQAGPPDIVQDAQSRGGPPANVQEGGHTPAGQHGQEGEDHA